VNSGDETEKNEALENYVLTLYVAGMTPKSLMAITSLQTICDTHLNGRYSLQVIDIYKQPELARQEQIIAVPTLIKKLPAPIRKFIGDLSETEKILRGLEIKKLNEVP
jgi:circadian clock protein KaiB